jgi:purine-nucleoside phosphorylase
MTKLWLEKAQEASQFFRKRWGAPPDLCITLGSGLSGFAEALQRPQRVALNEVPHACPPSVSGHRGELILGYFGGKKILAIAGRLHGFEGHSPHQVAHLSRAVRLWGCDLFVVTNATGCTHRGLKPGQIVLIKDQLNLTGQSPLTGTELFHGPRFPDMSDLFSAQHRKKLKSLMKPALKEVVYAGVNGPAYETAAEIRMLKKMGADIVGMSTVWETLALKQMGAEIVGLSCVTNYGTGVSREKLTHEDVLEKTRGSLKTFQKIIEGWIKTFPRTSE